LPGASEQRKQVPGYQQFSKLSPPYGIKTPCPQTYNLTSQSGAKTGLFSHQGPVVNTKMEPCCPPRKLSPRFVAKTQNRSNCGALFFPFSGVPEGVFLKSIFVLSGTRPGPRRPLWARIRIGGVQENPGFLIHSEMREVLRLPVRLYPIYPGSGKRGFPYRLPARHFQNPVPDPDPLPKYC